MPLCFASTRESSLAFADGAASTHRTLRGHLMVHSAFFKTIGRSSDFSAAAACC